MLLLRSSHPTASSLLPNPNGYDDLVKAGSMSLTQLSDPSPDELRALVAKNADALRLARAGLQKQCRVPVDFSMNYMSNHLSDLTLFKQLGRAFVAEGKLAEQENRTGDAAPAYLDAVRLGHECSRGGLIIDMLVGVACRSLGRQGLQGLLANLKAPECREVVHQLEDIDSKSESATEVASHERSWSRRTFGWRGQLVRLITRQRLKQSEQKTIGKLQAQQRAERLLLISLAARAYELEKGERPKNVAELVPNYLKALPQDPVSGTDIIP